MAADAASGRIGVYVRLRPLSSSEAAAGATIAFKAAAGCIVDIGAGQQTPPFALGVGTGETTTVEVCAATLPPLISAVAGGINACITCYGATGAGKTYTISGDGGSDESGGGLLSLALLQLFDALASQGGAIAHRVTVSAVEIYCEIIRDLLAEGGPASGSGAAATSSGAAATASLPIYGALSMIAWELRDQPSRALAPAAATPAYSRIPLPQTTRCEAPPSATPSTSLSYRLLMRWPS